MTRLGANERANERSVTPQRVRTPPLTITTIMDSPPALPLQTRALRFLKKLALRTRPNGGRSKDVPPVAIPSQDFQRAHSSVDLLRKPDVSPLIGFSVDVRPHPMDTDDSSQDASTSGNSPGLRSRRHSTWDSLHAPPVHPTFLARGAAPLFFRDQAAAGFDPPADVPGNVLAPAPLFLRSNLSLDAVIPPALSSPETTHTKRDGSPPPLGDALPLDTALSAQPADPTPSSPCHRGNHSRPQSIAAPEDIPSDSVPKRPALLPRHTSPLSPPFRLATERGLRLSPSIIARQPMPILNLPPLPPPPQQDAPPQKVPLRSMPSLSRHGCTDTRSSADEENAMPGESDEEDADEDEGDEDDEMVDALSVQRSDDEDEDPPSAGPSTLRSFQKQPVRDESHASPENSLPGPNFVDYFCSKTYVNPVDLVPSSTLAMYPFSSSIPHTGSANQRLALDPDAPIPGARLDHKPSLYRVASRSMINLGSTRRAELSRHKTRETAGSNIPSTSGHTTETQGESEESDTEAVIGRLLRRTSMPSFHPTSDPPPYPTFDPRPRDGRTMPPEYEGRERLPSYSNSLYLIAIMPRKLEFSAPGVQAKDRKWRRVVCELEGTMFRVYKCPPGASGAGVLGDWWEKRVGVGDMASPNPPRTRNKEGQHERSAKLEIDEAESPEIQPASSGRSTSVPPTRGIRPRSESQSSDATRSTMTSTPRPAKRISGASFLSPFRSSGTTQEVNGGESSRRRGSNELELLPVDSRDSHSSSSHESAGQASAAARRLSQPVQPRSASRLAFLPAATGRTSWRNGEIAKPPMSDLIRAYTLQHAESGLGNDYLKRKNVIRVRLEGEQFLLQAPDIPAVVEWIEGLHAGTNIALDIDQRPMPRGPMFPRRRRRRTRREEGERRPTETT